MRVDFLHGLPVQLEEKLLLNSLEGKEKRIKCCTKLMNSVHDSGALGHNQSLFRCPRYFTIDL